MEKHQYPEESESSTSEEDSSEFALITRKFKKFLRKEWDKAMKGEVTPNCRMQCSGCGAARWGGGVCVEGKN